MDYSSVDPETVKRLKGLPPFEDKVTEEEQTPEQEEKEEETPTEEEALDNSKNPERTKKYIEKLKEENAVYKQNVMESLKPPLMDRMTVKNEYFENPVNVLPQDLFTKTPPQKNEYPQLSQEQINDTFSELVDDQGIVDISLLRQTLKDQQSRAIRAEERAKQAEDRIKNTERRFEDFETKQLMRRVHKKYPMLDPNRESKFDPRFFKMVRANLVDQMTKGIEDPMQAAEEAYKDLYGDTMKTAKASKVDEVKRNINATGHNVSTAPAWGDREALIKATRYGSKGALAARLKASNY